MKVTYKTQAVGLCPVDDTIVDVYEVTVESSEMIAVERILEVIADSVLVPIYQEDLTVELAQCLHATVTTVGVHSGVKTTASA